MDAEGLRPIAQEFCLEGNLAAVEPFFGGHVNDSYRLQVVGRTGDRRYLLQRINTRVFQRPEALMENIERVTGHIGRRLAAEGRADLDRRVLRLVRTRDGRTWHRTAAGDYWRVYHFIDGSVAAQTVRTAGEVERVGQAFGEFHGLLSDYDGPRLHETIPNFHNTPHRMATLGGVVSNDPCGRVPEVRSEIEFLRAREELAGILLDLQRTGQIPERIVHYDAKISNVLRDAHSGDVLCVTDLDTVMPGLSLLDFGDMVRSMTSYCPEDSPDPTRSIVERTLFEALVRGYLSSAGAYLLPIEREYLVQAGLVITLEQGARFLTDFLNGDTYYKISRPGQNLDRCRTQLRLVASIEENARMMEEVVKQAYHASTDGAAIRAARSRA